MREGMKMIEIDGSKGEGGGQILRSSLSLSICTQQPFRITNIRANRDKPGLMRQHLTAVKAAGEICGGELIGAEIGSRELTFKPGRLKGGNYSFAIGTAGSSTLVLQTVLPPLLTAAEPSVVRITGGTHNRGSPPFDFLQRAFLPLIARMGAKVELELGQLRLLSARRRRDRCQDHAVRVVRIDVERTGRARAWLRGSVRRRVADQHRSARAGDDRQAFEVVAGSAVRSWPVERHGAG